MRVLVTVPQENKKGGIANYYSVIRNYYSLNIVHFTRGSRIMEKYFFQSYIRLILDYVNFLLLIIFKRFDIFHQNTSFGQGGILRDSIFQIIAKLFRLKTIIFFRGWDEHYEKTISIFQLWLVKNIHLKANAIVVLSNHQKKKIRNWGYSGPIFSETTLVDDILLRNFKIQSKLKSISSEKHLFTILYLGRVEIEKGIYETIQTFEILSRGTKNLKFIIAGDGSELGNATEYIKNGGLSNIELVGYVRGKKKSEIFMSSDIFIFPSYTEGMPNSLLEAMAFGLAVVSSPVGGIPEFFIQKEMGILISDRNPEKFANAIFELMSNPSQLGEISEFNYEYAKENFWASSVVKRIEKIYKKVYSS